MAQLCVENTTARPDLRPPTGSNPTTLEDAQFVRTCAVQGMATAQAADQVAVELFSHENPVCLLIQCTVIEEIGARMATSVSESDGQRTHE